jgi:hypothetical protein
VHDLGFRTWGLGLGFRVSDFGFQVQGIRLGCMEVYGLRFRA